MSDYSDKDFQESYEELLENVKTLCTKWDPAVSDESDPGVVILKTMALLVDKLNYKINYRNAQNSVSEVSDDLEGQKLFYDLGYQVKKKRSANGELSLRYLSIPGEEQESPAAIDLFTQFSDQSENIVYTSIRSAVFISPGEQKLISVQEGIPVRYSYEGADIFNQNHLTTNLRLYLYGLDEVSDNGVVICSNLPETFEIVSDWLNIGDSVFTSIETDNIFSIGHDKEGIPYIQFYEKSIKGIKNGIGIWIISSSGAAGNIAKNRISKIYYTNNENIDTSHFIIIHPEFINGKDKEDLQSAKINYYNTFGINETLVSERDYSVTLEKVLGPDLLPILSKALVSGVDGYQNLVEVVSKLENGNNVTFIKSVSDNLLSSVFVNALKYSDVYYESFKHLKSTEIENLIKKALFKENVVSNNVVLVGGESETGSKLYNRYLFDLATVAGTIIINTQDSVETVIDKVVESFSNSFNSRNLVAGNLISESSMSTSVKNKLSGVIDCSFHYTDGGHSIVKDLETKEPLLESEITDFVARSVLRGNVKLFEENPIQIPPGATEVTQYPSDSEGNSVYVSSVSGTYNLSNNGKLKENEFIQFYSISQGENSIYGLGMAYRLLANPFTIEDSNKNITSKGNLLAGSVIKTGSKFYSQMGVNSSYIGEYFEEISGYTNYYKVIKDYKVVNSIEVDPYSALSGNNYLEVGSTLADGSTWNGSPVYGFTLQNDTIVDLRGKAQLLIRTGDDQSTDIRIPNSDIHTIKISGFPNGLNSSGKIGADLDPGGAGKYLSSSQTITTYTEDSSNLSLNYFYGIVSDTGIGFAFRYNEGESRYEYLLQEGEHFIYSDENLLDFVDFGSGTLVSIESEKEEDVEYFLNNIVSLEEGDLAKKLVKLPKSVKLLNTSIYTYSGKEITLSGTDIENLLSSGEATLPGDWSEVSSNIVVTEDDGTQTTFGDEYYYRGGLLLKTGVQRAFNLYSGQRIDLIYSNGENSHIQNTVTGQTFIVSSNRDLYLNSADRSNLSELGLKMTSFKPGYRSYKNVTSTSQYTDEGYIIKYTVSSEDVDSYIDLGTNGTGYILKVSVNIKEETTSESGEGVGYVTVDSVNSSNNSLGFSNILILNNQTSSGEYRLGTGEYLIRVGKSSELAGIRFRFYYCGKDSSISIDTFRAVNGFNNNLNFISSDPSQSYTPDESLLTKISQILVDNSGNSPVDFDFLYEPESEIKNPTEVLQYYDEGHILNKNILTVLDLEKLRENLRIVRRTR